MILFGIYKFDGIVKPDVDSIYKGLFFEFLTMLATLFHISELQVRGLWIDSNDNKIFEQKILKYVIFKVENSDLSPDELMEDDELASPNENKLKETIFDLEDSSRNFHYMKSAKQIFIDDSKLSKSYGLPEFLSKRCSNKINDYFDRIIPIIPDNWDINLSNAAVGEKPGRSYRFQGHLWHFIIILFAILDTNIFLQVSQNTDCSSCNSLSNSTLLNAVTVVVIWLQIFFLVMDEVCYLRSSLRLKLLMHYVYTLIITFQFFLFIPLYTGTFMWGRFSLFLIFVFHVLSISISALQVRHGYKVFRGNSDMLSAKGYSYISQYSEIIFMAIPFAFEISCLLEWSCIGTSMSRNMFIMLKEIYSGLYQTKCEMERRKVDDTIKGFNKQSKLIKFFNGCCCFFILLLILLVPMFLFSSFSPSTSTNGVILSKIQFNVNISNEATILLVDQVINI